MKLAPIFAAVMFAGAYAIGQDASVSSPATTAPATQPTTAPSNRQLSADQMLSDILKSKPGDAVRPLQAIPDGPQIDHGSGPGSVAPNAPKQHLLREGTPIYDRPGRLNRSPDGMQAEFTFESDGKAMKDPPVYILPNLTLEQMENAVTSTRRDLRFRISGTITEYRGRNYVLLSKVVVVPDATQQF